MSNIIDYTPNQLTVDELRVGMPLFILAGGSVWGVHSWWWDENGRPDLYAEKTGGWVIRAYIPRTGEDGGPVFLPVPDDYTLDLTAITVPLFMTSAYSPLEVFRRSHGGWACGSEEGVAMHEKWGVPLCAPCRRWQEI